MCNYRRFLLFSAILLVTSIGTVQANSQNTNSGKVSKAEASQEINFPGRKTYAHVPYITIEDLHREYDKTVIVDARSPFEYDTLKILSAINIPLSLNNSDFTKELRLLRDKNPDKKIVFYCNGHTCMKSYKATHRAKVVAKIKNIYAFDAGIFDWVKAYPEKGVLLKQTPVNTNLLISETKYKQHMLPALQFINQANEDTIILDVRSRHQRDGFYVFSGFENITSLKNKKKLKNYIELAKKENKDLYIYDAVGKQVRWLQYFLEQEKAGPYYFMKGGAVAFFDIPDHELVDSQ